MNDQFKENTINHRIFCCFLISVAAILISPSTSYAGVFNIPHFVLPGEFAIGIEPDVVLTQGAGLGVDLKYTHGISDLNNLVGIVGTGGGPRLFRAGGALTFDIFPDIESQPGIGFAVEGLFVQLPTAGSFEMTGIPYIHKSFKSGTGNAEPFFAFPIGLSLSQGAYQVIATAAFGLIYQHNVHFSTVAEFGVSVNNSYTYFSGGLVYYH